MTANSQLLTATLKTKTKKQTKQTTSTGTESQKWRSHGGISVGKERGRTGEGKVQGIRCIIGRHKIDRERLRMVQETENSKNLYVQPMDMN